tara:strand:- start:53 stop:1261 length:1209 start_codon:yes stop_codon:yes gene_type:complete
MLNRWHKKEKPVFTGITRGIGGFGLGSTGLSNYWIATIGGTNIDEGKGIAVDSSDNLYIAGLTLSEGAGSDNILIVKYDFTGTIQWQRTLGGTSEEDGVSGIAADSSNNVYIVSQTESEGAGEYDIIIAKYNSLGDIQWQRTLGGTYNDQGKGIAVDSSNNVYITGRISATAGSADILIAKYNSSGTIQWQRTLSGTNQDFGEGIAVDSSNNVYIVSFTKSEGAGNFDILIAKYNSSGTIQWQRTLSATIGFGGSAQGISVDSSDNLYIAGRTSSEGAGGSDILIAKYNSSGTIQWQRTLGGTNSDVGRAIVVDSSDNLCIVGQTESEGEGSRDIIVAKLPNDGTLTGKYGRLTYASSSLTDSASSLTDASSSLTDASSSFTDASSSLTSATSKLIPSLINL